MFGSRPMPAPPVPESVELPEYRVWISTPPKSATAADVKDYAEAKGIGASEARQEFEDAGYRVE